MLKHGYAKFQRIFYWKKSRFTYKISLGIWVVEKNCLEILCYCFVPETFLIFCPFLIWQMDGIPHLQKDKKKQNIVDFSLCLSVFIGLSLHFSSFHFLSCCFSMILLFRFFFSFKSVRPSPKKYIVSFKLFKMFF